MKFLKFFGFMVLGAIFMVACLLWVSQFFNLEDDTSPVIWIDAGEEPPDPGQLPIQGD
jgi:hypothetical protein